MADGLVEVLPRDHADQPLRISYLDTALAMPLAQRHRARDRVLRGHEACRPGHDLAGRERLAPRRCESLREHGPGVSERTVVRRGRRLRVSSAAERLRDDRGIELGNPAPDDGDDPPVHLDEADEGPAGGEVDELVREHRHALHVLRPAQRGDENLRLAHLNRLERVKQRVEERPLVFPEGRVEVMRERLLPGSATQAPGERFDIPRRRGGMRERARVLVDPESEYGGLERRHRDLSLGEDAHERRREGPVGRVHRALVVPAGVVVEDDDIDVRPPRDLLQLSQP